jgi:3-oxoacyl-[acyl-carrier protein] reductase
MSQQKSQQQKLSGKVALVTGASKGIGAAIARQLAAEEAAVVINYSSSKAGADRVVADIVQQGGRAIAVQANLANPADIQRLFSETRLAFDRLDILVNNAGIYEFAPLISSVAATAGLPASAVYGGTKAAVDAVTRALAKELGPRKIRVNSVNPGMVETEGVHAAGIAESDFRKQIEAQTPLGRIGQPQDIATAVAFLASDDSSWITGETLYISGGQR